MEYKHLSGRLEAVYRHRELPMPQLLASPHEEVILSFLEQLSAQAFPEFVKDMLILTEGHTLTAVTDGPGDEQMDLLTISPDGRRCLVQCKHVNKKHRKCRGDDLDLLLAAGLRKNCSQLLLVTNGQLTTQAKRYILDGEYIRGWPKGSAPLIFDYRDGYRIWEKISTCSVMLNKWFSGLGQAHGLRAFRFELSVHPLPFAREEKADVLASPLLDSILNKLLLASVIQPSANSDHYEGRMGEAVSFRISRSFQLSNELDINYFNPDTDLNYTDKPLPSLVFDVSIANNATFNPGVIRQQLITYLLQDSLPVTSAENWWLLLAGRATSFIYLHDILEARQVALASAETFVLTDKIIYPELVHISLDTAAFKPDPEDHSGMYRHQKSGCLVRQLFAQEIEPYDEFNQSGMRNTQQEALRYYVFKCIKFTSPDIAARVRNIFPDDWFVFQGDQELICCHQADEDPDTINLTEKQVRDFGLSFEKVPATKKRQLLKRLHTIMPKFVFHDQMEHLRFPINLKRRLFWIAKPVSIGKKTSISIISDLYAYKKNYEQRWGNDSPPDHQPLSYRDLTYQLFKPNDIRGNRMLDINIWDDPFWIVVRFMPQSKLASNELMISFLEEFEQVFNGIKQLISKYI